MPIENEMIYCNNYIMKSGRLLRSKMKIYLIIMSKKRKEVSLWVT